ncbi:hypothetical protein [Paenibacillus sp.]|uniref:hypothetical protein n=1 Tax=Paenibacillus sp. TaxID=58172 RepID=UPI002D5F0904|nr:hypothetical protein [Paenibacillus sp.]HZG58525.1 hypothetical protein [Paenibacillus sp.]
MLKAVTMRSWVRVVLAGALLLTGAVPGAAAKAEESELFATVAIESADSITTASDGDLWASCWADDGYLYSANGDGRGFSLDGPFADIAVNRIAGDVGALTGETISTDVGQVWTEGPYNRKPTGMLCTDGAMYIAVQDLNLDFNDAPAATIAKSMDRGVTWTWDASAPMFDDYEFTTMMFLDYGPNGAWNVFDEYVYVYGFDGNWRDSFNDAVEDPTAMYLARMPADGVQDRSTWEWYAGDLNGKAAWTSDFDARRPVLEDARRVYPALLDPNGLGNLTVLSQGGVVYNRALNRYLYTSWTEYTFEFYESPTPWGPWKKFVSKDFGGYPWSDAKNGGYAASIPSKFISADGKTMYIQSNTFAGGAWNYNFSLRKMTVEPYVKTARAKNEMDAGANLADPANGTVPVEKVAHFGNVGYYNDGVIRQSEDSWNAEAKTEDWWGYTWPRAYRMNQVKFTTGNVFPDGGWFEDVRVQVRDKFEWKDVKQLSVTPDYPGDASAGANVTYTFTFKAEEGDGVRIIGTPGGSARFTSIGELSVYYADEFVPDPPLEPLALVRDGGFEEQGSDAIGAPWYGHGPNTKGIDRGLGFARTGFNNAWIRHDTTNWNAVKQDIAVEPNTDYVLRGWIRGSSSIVHGYFGAATLQGAIIGEQRYAGMPEYTEYAVTFNSGPHTAISVFAGFWGPGGDAYIQIDDVTVEKATP